MQSIKQKALNYLQPEQTKLSAEFQPFASERGAHGEIMGEEIKHFYRPIGHSTTILSSQAPKIVMTGEKAFIKPSPFYDRDQLMRTIKRKQSQRNLYIQEGIKQNHQNISPLTTRLQASLVDPPESETHTATSPRMQLLLKNYEPRKSWIPSQMNFHQFTDADPTSGRKSTESQLLDSPLNKANLAIKTNLTRYLRKNNSSVHSLDDENNSMLKFYKWQMNALDKLELKLPAVVPKKSPQQPKRKLLDTSRMKSILSNPSIGHYDPNFDSIRGKLAVDVDFDKQPKKVTHVSKEKLNQNVYVQKSFQKIKKSTELNNEGEYNKILTQVKKEVQKDRIMHPDLQHPSKVRSLSTFDETFLKDFNHYMKTNLALYKAQVMGLKFKLVEFQHRQSEE